MILRDPARHPCAHIVYKKLMQYNALQSQFVAYVMISLKFEIVGNGMLLSQLFQ